MKLERTVRGSMITLFLGLVASVMGLSEGPINPFSGGQILQTQVGSFCPAGCTVASPNYQQVGGGIAIAPSSPFSQLVIDCTFNAAVQLLIERNTFGFFRLFEHTLGGPVPVGHETGLYSVLRSFGAGTSTPATHRIVVENHGQQMRSFALHARSLGSLTPSVTVTGLVCTITEISAQLGM